jgi:MFS transporter, ACS family, glucarate transporter
MGEPSITSAKTDAAAEGPCPSAPTGVRFQVLGFGCALAVVTYVQRLGFAVGAPAIKRNLALDDAQVGDLMAAFMLAYGLFQVPGGLLCDRLGARHVLTFLVLGWSLVTAALGLAVLVPLPFVFLLVFRFLFGAFQAGGFPVLGRVLADWMPVTERGFAQGAVWMCSRWGGALIPFLLVWLFQSLGNWPIPFVLIGGLGVLWCAAFWPWFRNQPAEMTRVNRGERDLIAAGRPVSPSSLLDPRCPVPWTRMLRSLSVWCLCLMYGFSGFSGNFYTSMLPLYLSDHRHLSEQTTAWLSALPLAVGSLACVLGGFTSDRLIRRWGSPTWGRRTVGLFGLALAGVVFLSTIWVQDARLLALLLSATFFCNDLSMGPAWAACADIGERYAGTLSGAMNMIGALAGAIGAKVVGHLFHAGQSERVFILFAGVYLLAAVCWLGVDAGKRLAD